MWRGDRTLEDISKLSGEAISTIDRCEKGQRPRVELIEYYVANEGADFLYLTTGKPAGKSPKVGVMALLSELSVAELLDVVQSASAIASAKLTGEG